MRYTRDMRTERGSITAAAALLLSGVILFNTVLYDYVLFKVQESRISAGMLLACKSVLASYDSLLAEQYGLYGYNTGSGGSAQDLFAQYYHAEESHVELSGNFTEPEILKRQICSLMKMKTPVNIMETILESLGVISEAKRQGTGYRLCGEAAEVLTEMQKKHKNLKTKVEGYFQGDPACVNGYSAGVAADLVSKILESHETDAAPFLTQMIGLSEQYQEYNRQAALLCRELEIDRERIEAKLRQAESSSFPEEAASIRKQAAQMESGAAGAGIAQNLSLFSERISALQQWKNRNQIDPAALEELFLKRRVNAQIRINSIFSDGSGGAAPDIRQKLKEEILETAEQFTTGQDRYVISPEEYAALPSRRSGVQPGVLPYAGPDASSSFDLFGTFTAFFTFWDSFSFENLLRETGEGLLIDDYIINYMTSRLSGPSEDHLNNEIEYILNGDASAEQNNKTSEYKIIALRFLLDFIEIMKDEQRSAAAEALARAVAASLSMGAGALLYKFIIVSAWALLDAYQDLKTLLSGKAVPIIAFGKTENAKINDMQTYDFYLRILLLLTPMETKLLRICDMIEYNMKEITGTSYRLSGVYHKISAAAKVRVELISPFLLGKKRDSFLREDFCETSY